MKLHMRTKILILCLSSTLIALILQTFFFQRASANLIYNQAKTESFGTLQNMQNEIYTFVKNIESNLIEIYNNKDFLQDLKNNAATDSDMTLGELQDDNYRLAYTLATDKFNTSDGVVALYIYNAKHQIVSTYRRAVTPKHHYQRAIMRYRPFTLMISQRSQ